MSNDYVTRLVVEERLAGFRREAEQDRLAKLVRAGRPRRRWWERLMLFRTRPTADPAVRAHTHRRAAAVAASDSPC